MRTRTKPIAVEHEEYTAEEEPSIQQQVIDQTVAQKRVDEILGEGQTPFAKFMLDNKEIPEELKKILPLYFDKEFALTNISRDDAHKLRLNFRNSILRFYNSIPKVALTSDTIALVSQMEALFYAKIMRSTGGRDRERALYVTTIAAQEKPEVKEKKGGILSRFGRKMV